MDKFLVHTQILTLSDFTIVLSLSKPTWEKCDDGSGWKLNKVMGLVRVEGDGICLFHGMVIHSDYSCICNM